MVEEKNVKQRSDDDFRIIISAYENKKSEDLKFFDELVSAYKDGGHIVKKQENCGSISRFSEENQDHLMRCMSAVEILKKFPNTSEASIKLQEKYPLIDTIQSLVDIYIAKKIYEKFSIEELHHFLQEIKIKYEIDSDYMDWYIDGLSKQQ